MPPLFLLLVQRPGIAFLKRLFGALLFVLLLALFLFIVENEAVLAMMVFGKAVLIIGFSLLLFGAGPETFKSGEFAIARGMHGLGAPKKITALAFFAQKSIYMLFEELGKIRQSLYIRGFSPATSLFSYRVHAGLIAALIIRSLRRHKNIEDALEIRGYSGEVFLLQRLKPTVLDMLFIAVFLLYIILKELF